MNYIIGIDAGTSFVKAVLFDVAGNELMTQSQANEPMYIGDVEVEQDMNILWEKVAICIKKSCSRGLPPKQIFLESVLQVREKAAG
jgi:Sugar (pentulose and hexulose) kinases